MTVIRPNSISGVSSITGQGGDIKIFRADGTAADVIVNNITSGIITGTHYGSGANLTNIPAGNLTGTLPAISAANLTSIPAANLTGTLPAISAANLTSIPASNITGTLPAIDGSSLTGVGASFGNSSVNTSGIITATAFVPSQGQLSHRNKIINGAQLISQRRGNIFTSTVQNEYMTDRFFVYLANMDQVIQSIQQVTDSPDGFSRSLKLTTTTPETTIDSNEYMHVGTKLEGQDLQDLAYGTSNAKPIVLSFYVKSSITGTYGVHIYGDESTDRAINRTYTINSANTWERKTLPVILGDTSRVITDDTNKRFEITWHLAAGSDWKSGSANNTWGNWSNQTFAVGHAQNGVITTNGATWQITGVQLEVGSVATPFEHISYQENFRRCCRYYWKSEVSSSWGYGGYQYAGSYRMTEVRYPVSMRATPTSTVSINHGGTGFAISKEQYKAWTNKSYSSGDNVHTTSAVFDAELSI